MLTSVMEDAVGGVSGPMSTPANTPGMGNAVPPSPATGGIGSGDSWGDASVGKLATQAKPIKEADCNEENINPYDKLGTSIAKKMGVRS